jgi:ABC-type dipeptide/oligopeptide/nickel transport system permease subunit
LKTVEFVERLVVSAVHAGAGIIITSCLAAALLVVVIGVVLGVMTRYLRCPVAEAASAVSEVIVALLGRSRAPGKGRE